MSIFLYQIGMDRITAQPTNFAGLQINLPRKFKISVAQGFGNSKASFNNYRQFPELQDVDVTGTFLCANCESVSDQFNRLLSMSGKPHIDIIGYLPNDCCCVGESCGECGNCQGEKAVTWMTTTGVIESVERSYTIDGSAPYPAGMMEVSFKMTLDSYWYPLNPYIWYPEYNSAPYDSFARDTDFVKSILPTRVDSNSTFSFWKRNYSDTLGFYDTNLWVDMFNSEDGTANILSPVAGTSLRYRVRSPRSRWAAPPSSFYAFSNLPQTGEISIVVESEIAPFFSQEFTSSLDLEGDLNGLINFGIQPGDILIVSDNLTAPGFVLRDGAFVPTGVTSTQLVPRWEYSTNSPGELLGVDNYVTITVPTGVEVAYLHTFKGL